MITVDRVRSRSHVVVGSGVAGLTAALGLGDAVVLTKSALGAGSTGWAQGGIAAAVSAGDRPAAHAADTVRVAGGLAVGDVAELVTAAAPDRIRWLVELGARFDRTRDGSLSLGREAGHSRRRIVHADGDATGAELIRVLRDAVRSRPDIEVIEHALAVDLLRAGARIAGVVTIDADGGRTAWMTGSLVLSTGGIGRLYARTTNPPEVTGDGLAMAIRAGVRVGDLEFVQFHPTALAAMLDPLPLLTEALRGEGAKLVTGRGLRYLKSVHADAELAPRDIVARATWQRLAAGDDVFLDATGIPDFSSRFPSVHRLATGAGFDPEGAPMPVTPAAHFHMGGITTDARGRSSAPGLWVCGEAASTGLHGANRLASNSLLEGLAFGARIATDIAGTAMPAPDPRRVTVPIDGLDAGPGDDGIVSAVRGIMWDRVGVERSGKGLGEAVEQLAALGKTAGTVEARTATTVAAAIASAALARPESRGSHFRTDHPDPDEAWARRTQIEHPPVATTPLLGWIARGAA